MLRHIAVALFVVGILGAQARAQSSGQDARQNEPGKFDFFVLALSWSPSYCEAASERSPERKSDQQCGDRPFAFVVHGLWPQYDKGFPEFCQNPAPRLDRNIVSSMLDLMPAPRLVFQQWDKHGTCAGLPPRAYFEQIRKARAAIKIPVEFLQLEEPLVVSPAALEEKFLNANPGMGPAGFAVDCDTRRLREVRICLNRDLTFRDCPEVDRRACRRDQIVMPPMRSGRPRTDGRDQ